MGESALRFPSTEKAVLSGGCGMDLGALSLSHGKPGGLDGGLDGRFASSENTTGGGVDGGAVSELEG